MWHYLDSYPASSLNLILIFLIRIWHSSTIVFSPSRAYEWDGHEYGHGGTVALHVTFKLTNRKAVGEVSTKTWP